MALGKARHFLPAFANETIRLVLIINGPAVKLITAQAQKASGMIQKDASVMVCGNALTAYDVNNSVLWPGKEVVSNGIIEIVLLQNDGMAS